MLWSGAWNFTCVLFLYSLQNVRTRSGFWFYSNLNRWQTRFFEFSVLQISRVGCGIVLFIFVADFPCTKELYTPRRSFAGGYVATVVWCRLLPPHLRARNGAEAKPGQDSRRENGMYSCRQLHIVSDLFSRNASSWPGGGDGNGPRGELYVIRQIQRKLDSQRHHFCVRKCDVLARAARDCGVGPDGPVLHAEHDPQTDGRTGGVSRTRCAPPHRGAEVQGCRYVIAIGDAASEVRRRWFWPFHRNRPPGQHTALTSCGRCSFVATQPDISWWVRFSDVQLLW